MATLTHAHGHSSVRRSLDAPDPGTDPDDSSSDDNDPEDPVEDAVLEDDEDIARNTQWRFLARAFTCWFQSSQYADRSSSTSIDLQFDAFYVFLPDTAAASDTHSLQKLRDATALVAWMLQLDKKAWWFMRTARKPWFASFFPSNYDPDKLIPMMTFVVHGRYGPGDDPPEGVQLLRYLLVDCDRGDENLQTRGARAFVRAKRQLMDVCDPAHKLRGFKIPIAIQLRPQEAQEPDQLCVYLRDVIELVRAVQYKSHCLKYPFRLEEITLGLYLEHASDAHAELVELLALGVPTTIRLRHPHLHISQPFAWSDFGWRANLFPVFVDPAADSDAIHTLTSHQINSSVELLSAVAFSTSLRALEIKQDDDLDPEEELALAKWLAYALHRNTTLRSLTLHCFQGTHALLDAMESMVGSLDPARLLVTDQTDISDGPHLVRLKPDAQITTPEGRGPQSFAELNISSDWAFPVVRFREETIAFVIPGHAIGSTASSSILSIHAVETRAEDQPQSLQTLVLTDAYCDYGVLSRFLKLFGQSLEELRWAGSLDGGYDDDLRALLASCPRLTRLYLQGSCLQSLAAPWMPQLRTLSLIHTAVPMAELVAFFQSLADASSLLESFSYFCPGFSLDTQATEAALVMLAANRHLQSISLGIESQIYDEFEARFQDERSVEIHVEQLPLGNKLALCSVVQYQQKNDETAALGRLAQACLAHVFVWFTRRAFRRVRVIQSL